MQNILGILFIKIYSYYNCKKCHSFILRKIQYVSTISIGLVFIMYLLASLFGYLTFKVRDISLILCLPHLTLQNVTGPELFVMYSGYMPDDKLILVGRLMVLICVIFSAPLLHYPCRKGSLSSGTLNATVLFQLSSSVFGAMIECRVEQTSAG